MSLSSLYDGVGFGDKGKENKGGLDSTQIAGWSDNLQFMKTQLQLKKAAVKGPNNTGFKASKGLTTNGPGGLTLAHLTGATENRTVLVDEYNPLRPNDYYDYKERQKEKEDQERREKRAERDRREREKEEERGRDRDKDDRSERRRRRSNSRDRDRDDRDRDRDRGRDRDSDRDRSRRRRDDDDRRESTGRGGAAIAPPPSLLEMAPINPDLIMRKDGAGTGGFRTSNAAASNIMAKYGWKEGQGLGREEQGLSTCLQVEKTGKRAGKIINKDIEKVKQVPFKPPNSPARQPYTPPPAEEQTSPQDNSLTAIMKNPSKVVILKNMVGPGEVDDELQPEIEEECQTKYGEINKVIIFEIPSAPEEEAVRIFVEFKRMESAIKAIVDLNGRFFGGRTVAAAFYNLDKFRRLDLAS